MAGAAALALFGASVAMADVLVVRATGPSARSYPAGKSLADAAKVTLQANDTLVVLDARGTRTLRGPGTFTPGGPAQASRTSLASVTPQRRARIGAVRSVGMASSNVPRSPSIWHVDVAKSSNICVTDPAHVTLWRANSARPVELTVTPNSGRARTVSLAGGQATAPWPADLAIADGAGYRLGWAGAPAPTTITFRTLPAKPTALNDMAASLIQHGCDAQLDLLIETVKLPEDNATPSG